MPKLNSSSRLSTSLHALRSMLVRRRIGSAMTRRRHSIGGTGDVVAAVDAQVHRDVQHPGAFGDSPCRGRRCPTSRCARGPAARASARPGSGRARRPTRGRGAGGGCGADARPRRRPGTSTGCRGSSGPIAAPGRRGPGRRRARRPGPGRWQMAPLGPSRRMASRKAAIACSYRRSIRSWNPAKGIRPVPRTAGASWMS